MKFKTYFMFAIEVTLRRFSSRDTKNIKIKFL